VGRSRAVVGPHNAGSTFSSSASGVPSVSSRAAMRSRAGGVAPHRHRLSTATRPRPSRSSRPATSSATWSSDGGASPSTEPPNPPWSGVTTRHRSARQSRCPSYMADESGNACSSTRACRTRFAGVQVDDRACTVPTRCPAGSGRQGPAVTGCVGCRILRSAGLP
jgi:hypothetical protein